MNQLPFGKLWLLVAIASATGSLEAEQLPPYIRKCCYINESLIDNICVNTDIDFAEAFKKLFPEPDLKVDIIFGDGCKYGRYRLEPYNDESDEFELTKEGYLEIPAVDEPPISPTEYCLESFKLEDGSITVLPLVCFPPPQPEPFWKSVTDVLFPLGCMTSVPFLIMVLLVYFGISQLRDSYGKLVGCHCLCLAVAYSSLVYVQLFGSELSGTVCISFAYIIQFSFLSCFLWLNVLCYHTCYQTWIKTTSTGEGLGSVRANFEAVAAPPDSTTSAKIRWRSVLQHKSTRNATSRKQMVLFIKYNIFAWGVPTIILCITIAMDYSPTIPSTYLKPNVGVDACWFQGDKAVIPYFYGPISLILTVNIVYFILTARFLHKKQKRNEQKIHHFGDIVNAVISGKREKIFIKCLMLFCMMGLNWILEVLSWVVGGPPQLWIITDILNTLQGPILFWAFVYTDERVWRLAKDKYFSRCRKSQPPPPQPAEETLMIELPEIVRKI